MLMKAKIGKNSFLFSRINLNVLIASLNNLLSIISVGYFLIQPLQKLAEVAFYAQKG